MPGLNRNKSYKNSDLSSFSCISQLINGNYKYVTPRIHVLPLINFGNIFTMLYYTKRNTNSVNIIHYNTKLMYMSLPHDGVCYINCSKYLKGKIVA